MEDTAELVVPATSIKFEHASFDESSCSHFDETCSRFDETCSRSDVSSCSTPRPGCDSEEDNDEVEIVSPPAKKKKLDARTKGKRVNSHAQFLEAFAAIQNTSQEAYNAHEPKMQSEVIAFQAKLEDDRSRFEAEMSMCLQQSNIQFQQRMQQQNQFFQAGIFKRLFDNTSADKQ